jgi:hypothetical protein
MARPARPRVVKLSGRRKTTICFEGDLLFRLDVCAAQKGMNRSDCVAALLTPLLKGIVIDLRSGSAEDPGEDVAAA